MGSGALAAGAVAMAGAPSALEGMTTAPERMSEEEEVMVGVVEEEKRTDCTSGCLSDGWSSWGLRQEVSGSAGEAVAAGTM